MSVFGTWKRTYYYMSSGDKRISSNGKCVQNLKINSVEVKIIKNPF
jgi:hypothetical protein